MRTEPGAFSGWHHHGEHELVIYVATGALRMESGARGQDVFEAQPGDFVYVPPNAVHRESNTTDVIATLVVTRAGRGAVSHQRRRTGPLIRSRRPHIQNRPRSSHHFGYGCAAMPESENRAHEFVTVTEIEPLALMDGLRVRPVSGERITLGIFELDPGIAMPEHRHPNEQVGVVIRGEFTFTIGGETRLRKPGDMWVIPPGVPHTVERAGQGRMHDRRDLLATARRLG